MPNLNDPFWAAAATCERGYYLDNGACADCGAGYYCPGDDARYSCRDTIGNFELSDSHIRTDVDSVVGDSWGDIHAWDKSHCHCYFYFSDQTRVQYMYSTACQNGPSGDLHQYTFYQWCRPGYYATSPLTWGEWYTACAPCDNGPANSHYTSYSTPSEIYAVESNCPWACDAGYGRVGDECKPLCGAGVTQLRAGDMTVLLWAARQTTPALVVGINGSVCYGNLTLGRGDGINIQYGTAVYHTL